MKIPKRDAKTWLTFFAQLPPGEVLLPKQQEILLSAIDQIERAVAAKHQKAMEGIPGLKTFMGRTHYVGDVEKFPGGCKSCLGGTGLSAIRRTHTCNISCKFCYNYGELDMQPPLGEGYFEIGGTKVREEDIPLLCHIQGKPSGVSYVYLEPFMEIGKYEGIIRWFHGMGVHQHMYTNGTLATQENLRMLGAAGLDELRFNLGATNCADSVIGAMAMAKDHIPKVGIETPMTKDFYDGFLAKKAAILGSGIDFMNCAELHLNPNNIGNYLDEPMYMHRQGYVSPINSRLLTLSLMAMAARERWSLVVHDCANHTKYARGLHQARQEGGWFGKSDYAMEFAEIPAFAFLKTLEDPAFHFLEEEPLPVGYRPGDLAL